MPETELSLSRIRATLDQLSEEVSRGRFPASILKDLKLSVDNLRLTLWAIIAFEGSGGKDARGASFGLTTKLAEFRIKRLLQMLSDLQEDLQSGDIAPSNPALGPLVSVLESACRSVTKLTQSAS
jgi:hypothetical protein